MTTIIADKKRFCIEITQLILIIINFAPNLYTLFIRN